jgi:hypothetical protein
MLTCTSPGALALGGRRRGGATTPGGSAPLPTPSRTAVEGRASLVAPRAKRPARPFDSRLGPRQRRRTQLPGGMSVPGMTSFNMLGQTCTLGRTLRLSVSTMTS